MAFVSFSTHMTQILDNDRKTIENKDYDIPTVEYHPYYLPPNPIPLECRGKIAKNIELDKFDNSTKDLRRIINGKLILNPTVIEINGNMVDAQVIKHTPVYRYYYAGDYTERQTKYKLDEARKNRISMTMRRNEDWNETEKCLSLRCNSFENFEFYIEADLYIERKDWKRSTFKGHPVYVGCARWFSTYQPDDHTVVYRFLNKYDDSFDVTIVVKF